MRTRVAGLSSLLLGVLCQAMLSGAALAQLSSAGSSPDSNAAGTGGNPDKLRYAGPYHAGTSYAINDVVMHKGVSYRALSNGASDDPELDVLFAAGYWTVFAGGGPLWATGSTPALGIQGFSARTAATETRQAPRLRDQAAVAQKSRTTSDYAFCNEVRPYIPPYDSGHGEATCSVHSRDDYAALSLLLLFSLFQQADR